MITRDNLWKLHVEIDRRITICDELLRQYADDTGEVMWQEARRGALEEIARLLQTYTTEDKK